jgi:predicted metal-binding membrane protein
VTLLALSAAAWIFVSQDSHGDMVPSLVKPSQALHVRGGEPMSMSADMADMTDMTDLTDMHDHGASAGTGAMAGVGMVMFLGMWVAMMVAMMFPAVAPVVVGYNRISRRRSQGFLAPAVFVLSYLVVWSTIGLVAYRGYRLVLDHSGSLSDRSWELAGGAALIAAGVYQFSKLKTVCLRRCRGVLQLAFEFQPGPAGAARMGTSHGLWCLGCCWGLMLVLFTLGLMNLAWMGVVAAVIFVEKLAPRPEIVARVVGLCLSAGGVALIA